MRLGFLVKILSCSFDKLQSCETVTWQRISPDGAVMLQLHIYRYWWLEARNKGGQIYVAIIIITMKKGLLYFPRKRWMRWGCLVLMWGQYQLCHLTTRTITTTRHVRGREGRREGERKGERREREGGGREKGTEGEGGKGEEGRERGEEGNWTPLVD